MDFQYGDDTSQDSTDLTEWDIPVYVGDTDSTSRYMAASRASDIVPFYSYMGTTMQ